MNQVINIKDLGRLLNAAVALHQSDQKTGAEEKYAEVLSYERDFQGAMKSDTPEALQQSTLLRTIFSQAYNNLGILREDELKFGQAISNFRDALDFAPGSIEAHTNLGRVFRKKGNYDSALAAIRGALDLKPDYIPAIIQLCKISFVHGGTEEALAAISGVEDRLDENFRLNIEYGLILDKIGRPVEAREKFRRALELSPDNLFATLSLGNVNFKMGKYGDALENYRAILEIDSSHLLATTNIGVIYQRVGQFDEALKAFKNALAIDQAHQETLSFYASILEITGNYSGALGITDELLMAPKVPERALYNAMMVKAKCLRKTNAPLEALETLKAVLDGPIGARSRHQIYYELGHCYDLLAQEKEAFQYYQKANQVFIEEGEGFQAEKHLLPDFLEATLDEDFSGYFTAGYTLEVTDDRPPPVFIVGGMMGGVEALSAFIGKIPGCNRMHNSTIIVGLRRAISKGDTPYPGCLKNMPEDEARAWAGQYKKLQQQFSNDQAKGIPIHTYPLNFLDIPLIVKLFPKAKFVFTKMHPHDVVLNSYMKNFGHDQASMNFADLEEIARIYASCMDVWAKFKREIPFKYIEISHEALMANPGRELKKVIKFIDPKGADIDKKPLDKAALAEILEGVSAIFPPLRWQRYKKYLKPVIKILDPYTKKLGY